MKTFVLPIVLAACGILFTSCEEASKVLNDTELTEEEMTEGLKAALKVGTDTASTQLSRQDGYFRDEAVKILLPAEVQASISEFKTKTVTVAGVNLTGEDLYQGYSNSLLGINIPGLQAKEDELIKGVNRAAESAASTAGPIFFEAIADITIADANELLFGGNDHAATEYLADKTSGRLFNEYEPKIDAALQSVKVGNTSVADSYESFVQDYNAVLNTSVGTGSLGSLMDIEAVQAEDLSEHSTQKGLDGLFLKIAEEEEDIRNDPAARVTAILSKVFTKKG